MRYQVGDDEEEGSGAQQLAQQLHDALYGLQATAIWNLPRLCCALAISLGGWGECALVGPSTLELLLRDGSRFHIHVEAVALGTAPRALDPYTTVVLPVEPQAREVAEEGRSGAAAGEEPGRTPLSATEGTVARDAAVDPARGLEEGPRVSWLSDFTG